MHEGTCNTEDTRTCPETLCPYHVVKNCVWNTDSIRGNVEVGDCAGYNSEWNSGSGTCYQQIDTSYEIPAGQAIAVDDIGYKIVYGKNTTDAETALRCYNPSNGNVVSVAGTEGLSYEQVKSMCRTVSDYPKPWTRWGLRVALV